MIQYNCTRSEIEENHGNEASCLGFSYGLGLCHPSYAVIVQK